MTLRPAYSLFRYSRAHAGQELEAANVAGRIRQRSGSQLPAHTKRIRWTSILWTLAVWQLLSPATPASAQGSWSGVLTDLSGNASSVVREPDVAVDGAGNAIAVWARVGERVEAARYTAATASWSGPVGLAPGLGHGAPVRVAMDAVGNAVVVWREGGGAALIRAVRYLVGSGTWTAPVTISDPAMGSVFNAKPSLAVDPAGNALVVWQLTIPRGRDSDYVVQGVRFAAASATWSTPVTLSAATPFRISESEDVAVAADALGNGMAVWKQVTGLQAARYLAANGWQPAVDLSPGQSGVRPAIVVDSLGNATVAWAETLQPQGVVRATRYTTASGAWSTPFDLTTTTPSTASPQLAVDPAGNVTAIWEEGGLRSRRYAVATASWQEPLQVASPRPGNSGPFVGPQLTADGQGVVTAVWSNNLIIESARYGPSSTAWSSPVALSRINALNYRASLTPRLGADTAGNVAVVWHQAHGGDFARVVQSTRWQASGAANNTVPSGLQPALIGTQVSLRWVAPLATVTSFVVEAGSSPGAADLAQLDIGSTTPFVQVNAPPGIYYVRVRARVNGMLSLPSNEVRLTVGTSCVPPTAPVNLTNTTTSTSVSLSWQAGTGATSYVLEAGSSPGQSNVAVLNTASSATTFSAAAPPGLYYVRLRSRNACGTSEPSNETTVAIGCSAPSAPGALSATVSGANVALSWGPASGAASYIVEAGSAPGASNLGHFPAASLGLAASAPRGTYYVRVRALSACGSGPASNEVVVEIQ